MSHYTMLHKYGKRTRGFGGIFIFIASRILDSNSEEVWGETK